MKSEVRRSVNDSSGRFSTVQNSDSEALGREHKHLLALLESSSDVFYGLDAEWRFTYLNRRAEALWGRKREQLIGENIWEAFPQGVQTQAYQEMHRSLAEQRAIRFETYSAFLKSWVEVEVYPTENGLGVYFHDIHERKQAEEGLARLAAIVTSSNDAIISETLEGVITSWNQAAERIFGYSADEVIGQPITLLIPAEKTGEEEMLLQKIAAGETVQNYDTVRLKKDGSLVTVSVTLSPIQDREGHLIGASKIAADVTERKRAERQLRQSEAALSRHTERLAAINRLDRLISSKLDITQVYDNFVQELQALIPLDRTAIVRLNEAGDQWRVIRQWTRHQPGILPGEWRPVAGSVLEWLITQRIPFSEPEVGERGQWPETAILQREGIRSRLLIPLIIGDQVVGLLTAASHQPAAFSDEDQSLLMTIADQLSVAIENADLYAQVQEYAAGLEERVRVRTAELEASNHELEAFSYSVSHDLRSPLRAIDGFSRILLRDYGALLPDEGQRRLQLVRDSAQQMGQLIDDLLAYSRLNRQALNRQPIALTQMVNQVFEALSGDRENRQIELVIDPLPTCQADPTLLRQVLVNLLSNALKFTRQRASARIEVGSREIDGARVYFVQDNGAGFDMRYADKLFGVFQRLHRADEFEGTGVGLATVQRIIHRHGGRVWAEAELDKGATFYFTLGEGA